MGFKFVEQTTFLVSKFVEQTNTLAFKIVEETYFQSIQVCGASYFHCLEVWGINYFQSLRVCGANYFFYSFQNFGANYVRSFENGRTAIKLGAYDQRLVSIISTYFFHGSLFSLSDVCDC